MTSLITLSVSVCGHQGESDWQEMDGDDNAEAFHAARWCDTLSRLSVYGLVDHLQLRNNQIHSSLLIGRILVTLALQGDRWGLCIWKGCYEILSNCSSILQLPRLRRRGAWAIFSRHETFSLRRSGGWSNGAVGYCLKLSCEVLSTVREGSRMSRLAQVKGYYSSFPYHNCCSRFILLR